MGLRVLVRRIPKKLDKQSQNLRKLGKFFMMQLDFYLIPATRRRICD